MGRDVNALGTESLNRGRAPFFGQDAARRRDPWCYLRHRAVSRAFAGRRPDHGADRQSHVARAAAGHAGAAAAAAGATSAQCACCCQPPNRPIHPNYLQAQQQIASLQTSVADVEANLALSVYEQLLLVTVGLAALTVLHQAGGRDERRVRFGVNSVFVVTDKGLAHLHAPQALLWFWRWKWPDGAKPLPSLLVFPRIEIILASATIVCMAQVTTAAVLFFS